MDDVNLTIVTINDCIEMFERKNKITIIENGGVVCFEMEE